VVQSFSLYRLAKSVSSKAVNLLKRYKPSLIVLVAYLLVLTAQLAVTYDWNPTGLINFGTDTPPSPSGAYVEQGSKGFDGAYYYTMAKDPLLTGEGAKQLQQYDSEYRAGRIVYPLLSAAVGFGSDELIPWAMLLVNLAAVFVLVVAATKWLEDADRSRWYAVAIGLLPGVAMAVTRDLTDVAALAATVLGLLYWQRKQFSIAATVLSVALLTRETAILALAVPLWGLLTDRKEYPLRSISTVLVPLGCFTFWQLYVKLQLGSVPVFSGMINQRELPFIGQIDALSTISQLSVGAQLWTVTYMLLITATAVLCIYLALKRKSVFTLALLVAGVLTVVAGSPYWEDPWSFARATLPLSLLLFLFTSTGESKTLLRFSLLPALMTPLAALASLG